MFSLPYCDFKVLVPIQNKHEYRAGVAELHIWVHTKRGTDIRQTNTRGVYRVAPQLKMHMCMCAGKESR